MKTQVILRQPRIADATVLTQWENIDGNDPVNHRDMVKFISENQQLLAHGQQRFVIDFDGKPVGTVDLSNLTADGSAAYVSIYVDNDYRAKKMGTHALNLLIKHADALGLNRLGAIINNKNIISQALFAAAGFVPVSECNDFENTTVWMLSCQKRN